MKPDKSGQVRIKDRVIALISNNTLDTKACSHIAEIADVTPSANGCEDCLKTGDNWVHLRLCMICGHVGCCDNSKNKHATRHFHETHHPIITSFEPGESWVWCYQDEVGFPI